MGEGKKGSGEKVRGSAGGVDVMAADVPLCMGVAHRSCETWRWEMLGVGGCVEWGGVDGTSRPQPSLFAAVAFAAIAVAAATAVTAAAANGGATAVAAAITNAASMPPRPPPFPPPTTALTASRSVLLQDIHAQRSPLAEHPPAVTTATGSRPSGGRPATFHLLWFPPPICLLNTGRYREPYGREPGSGVVRLRHEARFQTTIGGSSTGDRAGISGHEGVLAHAMRAATAGPWNAAEEGAAWQLGVGVLAQKGGVVLSIIVIQPPLLRSDRVLLLDKEPMSAPPPLGRKRM